MPSSRTSRLPAFLAVPLLVLVVATAVPAAAAPAAPVDDQLTGRVLVTFDAGFSPLGRLSAAARSDQRDRLAEVRSGVLDRLAGAGLRPARSYRTLPYLAVEASAETVRALRADPAVTAVRPDQRFTASLADSVHVVGAPRAWAAGAEGDGQVVALLDSGVQADHPFLAGKIVTEACFSASSDCPDGSATQVGTGAAAPCAIDTTTCPHGTHIAGIIAGNDPAVGLAGVARSAQIAAVQVFSRETQGCPRETGCATALVSDLLAGLDHVAQLSDTLDIAAVNLSLGGGSYPGTCDADQAELAAAVESLRSLGILTIAASGNEGNKQTMSAPACLSAAVAVGSSSKTDVVSSFSNSSSKLALLAPGEDILSSWPQDSGNELTGTSQAVPHVAGAVAVLRGAAPAATATQVLSALTSTGRPLTDAANGRTTPRLQVDEALAALTGVALKPAATGSRLSGTDRYDTAARVFSDAFGCASGGASSAVLARGDAFADALTGSYLAGSRDTGLLLTDRDGVPAPTLAALRSSGASTVYLLGGTTAIGPVVADQLARTASVSCSGVSGPALRVVRVSGDDRYSTALAVAEQVGSAVGTLDSTGRGTALSTAVVASGAGFADALAAGPISYAGAGSAQAGNQLGFPLLLTGGDTLGADAASGLRRLGIQQVLLPGGTAVLSPQVERQLGELGIGVIRLAGLERTATAAELARFAVGDRPGHPVGVGFDRGSVSLARGDGFVDALAGAAHAGSRTSPLLLSASPQTLGEATTNYLRSQAGRTTKVTAYGGVSAVATDTLNAALVALTP